MVVDGYGPMLEHATELGFAASQVGFSARKTLTKKTVPKKSIAKKPVAAKKTEPSAINHINYSQAFGSLEMDSKDGELRVRTAMKGVGDLDKSKIEQVIDSALATANRFQAALLAVAFGNAPPETAVDLA